MNGQGAGKLLSGPVASQRSCRGGTDLKGHPRLFPKSEEAGEFFVLVLT